MFKGQRVQAASNNNMADSSLPLTTVFTPATACAQRLFTLSAGHNPLTETALFWEDWTSNTATVSCYPREVASATGTWKAFSPGVCPSGYVTIRLTISHPHSKTVAQCCPS